MSRLRKLAWVAGVVGLAIVFVLRVVRSVRDRHCDVALPELDEPAGWRDWPVLPNRGGYTVVDLEPPADSSHGWTSRRPQALGKATLTAPGLCPERGASLDGWFTLYDSYRRSEGELAVRRAPGRDVWVVAGQVDRDTQPQGEERFVVAFQRARDSRCESVVRFLDPPLLAALALLGVVLGLRAAYRR